MELWIRSQNKKKLVKVNDVENTFDSTEGHFITDINGRILGKYDSNERCLEIMDEIQKLLTPKVFMTSTPMQSQSTSVPPVYCVPNEPQIQMLDYAVYEMPEK